MKCSTELLAKTIDNFLLSVVAAHADADASTTKLLTAVAVPSFLWVDVVHAPALLVVRPVCGTIIVMDEIMHWISFTAESFSKVLFLDLQQIVQGLRLL